MRIVLLLMVRNESAIIERCLASVAPHIDCYAICDTGSSDRTVEIIRSFMDARGIPGIIPTTTFRNFEQARNESLDAAHAAGMPCVAICSAGHTHAELAGAERVIDAFEELTVDAMAAVLAAGLRVP